MTCYTRDSGGFVASTAAPIATGWSDPVAGRVCSPLKNQRLFTAYIKIRIKIDVIAGRLLS
jgi:hypothetical protein